MTEAACGATVVVRDPADCADGWPWRATCTRESGHDGPHVDEAGDWTWGAPAEEGLAFGRDLATEGVFDLADRGLRVGDVFRWPCGTGARRWRITAIVEPEVDDVVQRVRAVPAGGEERL